MKNILLLGVTLMLTLPTLAQAPDENDPAKVKIMPKIALKAQPFALRDVTLLDGPFKDAMARNAKYLLDLEPDRLLHRFRLYAGLVPKAPIYGGWESQGVSGHILGHYLSACAMQYEASGDEKFRQRVNYIVDELALCQDKHGDGYVGAIPDADRIFKEVSEGKISSQGFDLNGGWVPWYTLHKLFAGLIDANLHCGSDKAKTVATRLADWAIATTANLSDEQWQRMLACEHGGMNESLAQLYALTGEPKYLDLSRKFYHRAILDPLAAQRDELAGKHGNTQIPKVIGAARIYELTGDEKFATIARFFWERVTQHHSYVMGGHGAGEHFGPPDKLNDRLSPSAAETCNTYNMLKLTRHLFEWQPQGAYGDFYERALYNHILASQDPQRGMVCYYVSLLPGHFKSYSDPFDSFWCCVGTGIENHVKYNDSIYFHDGDNLWVNLFIPSQLLWKEKGVTLRLETHYPADGAVKLKVACDKPTEFTLRLRVPGWLAKTPTLAINGKAQEAPVENGYLVVRRVWQGGDEMSYDLPLQLRQEAMPDNPKRVAILYGPSVLAGELGTQGLSDARIYGKSVADVGDDLPRVPVIVAEDRPLDDWVKPVAGQTLAFETQGVGKPADVRLIPFAQMHHERFTIYWDVFTPDEWAKREAEIRAEEERRKAMQARTVDSLAIGEMQSERDHNVQGEKTGVGDFAGHKWRHAADGGWFSFDMKVQPDQPGELALTFWGSEVGNRTFDVLVNGTKIATQTLNNDKPGKFFDVLFPLPDELTKGKDKITVKLQAHPGNFAGGLFGASTLRRVQSPKSKVQSRRG